MTENYFKINAGKTKFMVIGSQYNMRNNRIRPIKLFDESNGEELEKLFDESNGEELEKLFDESNGEELEKLDTVLTLGVNIDRKVL